MASRVHNNYEGFHPKDIDAFGFSRLREQRAAENRGRGFALELDGAAALNRLFDELPEALNKVMFRKVLRAAANWMLTHIKSIVPVLKYDKAGRIRGALKRFLKVRAMPRSRKRFGYNILTPYRTDLMIGAQETHYYPAVVEFGDHDTPPHSYIRKGWDDKEHQIIAFIEQEVGRVIDQMAAKTRAA